MIADHTGFNDDFVFGKNMVLAAVFFLITPITLAISLFSLFSLNTSVVAKNLDGEKIYPQTPFSGVQVYASLPEQLSAVSGEIGSEDARVEIVSQYLKKYKSPLISYAGELVQVSDKYNLDFRLLPAIAQQESNLCKIIPPGSHNCWGWGIHSAGSLGFESYSEAIETVARGLKLNYQDKGFVTVPEIMSKYNPISPEGAWGKGVELFMSDME